MRILDRYIAREVSRHALLGLIVFTFVFFVPRLVRLMELFVRHTGSSRELFVLLFCTFPGVFAFTIPMAVLIGVLLGLGRMSADSELIALTALGIGRTRILLPVGELATAGAAATMVMTLWLGPTAIRTFRATEASLAASQASFQVQPRVFDERFPRLVLYVNDVAASGTQWRGVFLAEAGAENASRVTLAEEAIVIAEPKAGKVELHLRGGTTHEVSRQDPEHYSVTAFGDSDWPLEVSGLVPAAPRALSNPERSNAQLLADRGPDWRAARVELHQRVAFPVACFTFALVAVPLAARPRRGGRAAGFLLAIVLIAGYYLLFIIGANLAREGTLPPWLGIWAANLLLGLLGIYLLPRMEQFRGDVYLLLRHLDRLVVWMRFFRRRARARALALTANGGRNGREGGALAPASSFPRLMDLYLLRRFFFHFALLMAIFIFLLEVFTLFELLDDIRRHSVTFVVVVNYFRYFTPYLAYQLAPLGALVAVLVTLGIMSKNNEIIACKASGVSLYRLALPLLLGGLTLASTMFLLDYTYLPYANRRQDALRNQIKGKPPQTYFHPRRQWIFGENAKIYNYELFDPERNFFGQLNVLELDPASFRVRRRIYAERAHWERSMQRWALESGWIRDFSGGTSTSYTKFPITTLPELNEPPSYFNREVRQAFQMSWRELRGYIDDLHNAGFDVSTLTVQWHEKLAFPLIAPVSMLLAMPFALLVGTRGAIGGVALGIGIALFYLVAARLLEAMGGVGQLPPLLAGWSPDMIFLFLGMYFFLRMPT